MGGASRPGTDYMILAWMKSEIKRSMTGQSGKDNQKCSHYMVEIRNQEKHNKRSMTGQ
jgi:hypothetical protein